MNMDKEIRVVVPIEEQKRKKFKMACTQQNTDMATIVRKFIAKFIREPKKTIDFINS